MIEIRKFNVAFLGKCIWSLGTGEIDLWKEVVESKYRGWRNVWAQTRCKSYFLWWRDLKEVWSLKGWKGNFEDNFFWDVRNGR